MDNSTILCIDCGVKKPMKRRRICASCKNKRYREAHPEMYCYHNLKNNAKRRGKGFTLTFEEYKEFAVRYDYTSKRGRGKFDLHIDRIREEDGYHINNIQVLPNIENLRKYIEFAYVDENRKKIFKTITIKPNQNFEDDSCPF